MASISILALPGWGNVLSHGPVLLAPLLAYERSGCARGLLPSSPGESGLLTLSTRGFS
jgi:hypothetical protein